MWPTTKLTGVPIMSNDKMNSADIGDSCGKKYDFGKPRFDLIPIKPLLAVADLFTRGAMKYGVRNWEKGMAFGRIFSAMMRHAVKWWAGEKYDPEDGQHHLAAVIWGGLILMELEETHPECDEREPQNKRFTDSSKMFAEQLFEADEKKGDTHLSMKWKEYEKLRDKASKLRDKASKLWEDNKLRDMRFKLRNDGYTEGYELREEGDRLRDEGWKLRKEGFKLYRDAVKEVYGDKKVRIDWKTGEVILL